MNAKVPLAKMEALAQIMLTPTPVPVCLGLLASTAKQTSLIVLKVLASMGGHAQIKSMDIPVLVALASLGPTASMKSMSVTPSPASMEAFVRMPWSHSVALAPRAILATVVRRQLIGAGAHLHVIMEDAAVKRMPHSSVNVLMAGLAVTVTSLESPVKQLPAKEGSRRMNYATMVVTVLIPGILTIANVLMTTLEAIAKIKWIIVKTNLVAMAPPAGDMWEDTSVIVCQVIPERTAR